MKAQIHPNWLETRVSCSCGNVFTVGGTVPEIHVEVCSACHPFYTGQMKYVDTAGRVDAFNLKKANALKKIISKAEKRRLKKEKQLEKELERPDTLEELRKAVSENKAISKNKKG